MSHSKLSASSKLNSIHQHFKRDSLFRNSMYLMAATGVMAGFGFFFWLVVARLFSTAEVGLATTLISAMNLIALLSLIGFDTVLVRFLPNSDDQNDKTNTALLLVGLASLLISSLFIAFVPQLSQQMMFVRESALTAGAFIFFSVVAALNVLTDAFFLAKRQAKYTLGINTIFSAVKVVLPFGLADRGPMAIFVAAGFAQFVGLALSLVVMIWRFGYRPSFSISGKVVRQVRRYSSATYAAGLLNLLPPTILPLLITNRLGAEQSAYFYVVFMFANLLYTVSLATTRSLFAEGSHQENELAAQTRQALKLITILTIPCMILIIPLSSFILGIFGADYAAGGSMLLNLMTISALPVSTYSLYVTVFRIEKALRALIILNVVYAVTILGLSYALASLGLTGIGYAWLAGNVVTTLLGWAMQQQGKLRLQPA